MGGGDFWSDLEKWHNQRVFVMKTSFLKESINTMNEDLRKDKNKDKKEPEAVNQTLYCAEPLIFKTVCNLKKGNGMQRKIMRNKRKCQ